MCAAEMEAAIGRIDGVASAKVAFMSMRLTIEADEADIVAIEEKAESAVKKIEPGVKLRRA